MRGPDRGVSTWDTIEAATKPGGKAQVIDISRLGPDLEAVKRSDGHVSIRPKDDSRMADWAAHRGEPHPLTQQIKDAVTERDKRRPKSCPG